MEVINTKLALCAIKDFVQELCDIFKPKSLAPLGMYSRILASIKDDEVGVGVDKCIKGFKLFINQYGKCLEDINTVASIIPRDTHISYGDSGKVYIDIQYFLYKSKGENKEAIRMHLLTILAILEPSEQALANLSPTDKFLQKIGLEKGSMEANFVEGIMIEAKLAADESECENPGEMLTKIITGKLLPKVMEGLKNGEKNGMDLLKLVGVMQGAMEDLQGAVNEDKAAARESGQVTEVDIDDETLQMTQEMTQEKLKEILIGNQSKKVENITENELDFDIPENFEVEGVNLSENVVNK